MANNVFDSKDDVTNEYVSYGNNLNKINPSLSVSQTSKRDQSKFALDSPRHKNTFLGIG